MKGKKIVIGITGSIAAYKTAGLIRLLVKAGAEVQVIMTRSAADFITPLTLSVLSGRPVLTEPFNKETGAWNNHVSLGIWADAILVAPLSANTMAKMAGGICDNLLLAVLLSARCPVLIAPAMDLDMWKHPATRANLKTLEERGVVVIPPATGELASGLTGEGRMEEPELILDQLNDFLGAGRPLKGTRALVTAGPTFEAIDPVRFIGNRSSGKMGFAIAEELARQGAQVTLVTGPSALQETTGIKRVDVESAAEMEAAVKRFAPKSAIVVMAAAVADYRPARVAQEKIKKARAENTIDLVPTHDILAGLGRKKTNGQLLIGFALETENEVANASAKLKSKNLDLVVLNSLRDAGAGFGYDTNKVTLIDRKGRKESIGLGSKKEIAAQLVSRIISMFKK